MIAERFIRVSMRLCLPSERAGPYRPHSLLGNQASCWTLSLKLRPLRSEPRREARPVQALKLQQRALPLTWLIALPRLLLPGTLTATMSGPLALPRLQIILPWPRILPWALFATTLATLARLNVFSTRHVTFLSLIGGSSAG